MRRIFVICTACVAIASGVVTACSGDDTTNPATGDSGVKDATNDTSTTADTGGGTDTSTGDVAQDASAAGLSVTVSYAGTKTGTLSIAVFPGTAFPPAGPPVGAFRQPNATFPVTHAFTLAAGDYVLSAFLDVGDNNPQTPGPEDVLGAPVFKPVTIANTLVTETFTLVDSDGCAGDAGDGGDSG
jgi:hypothetical protein